MYLFCLERVILTHACTVAGPMCVTCQKGLGGEEKQHHPALSGTMHPKAALDSGAEGCCSMRSSAGRLRPRTLRCGVRQGASLAQARRTKNVRP
jgi:hypothetical protein